MFFIKFSKMTYYYCMYNKNELKINFGQSQILDCEIYDILSDINDGRIFYAVARK